MFSIYLLAIRNLPEYKLGVSSVSSGGDMTPPGLERNKS
jgi:hypothetical protein